MSESVGLVSFLAQRASPAAAAVFAALLLSACQTSGGVAAPSSTPSVAEKPVTPAPALPRSTYRPAGEATPPGSRCGPANGIPVNDSFAIKSCLEREVGFSDRLKTIWARVSDDDVRYCETHLSLEAYDPRPYSARAMYACLKGRISP